MQMQPAVIKSTNVRDYFREQVLSAMMNQNVEVDDVTTVYIVNVLTQFTRSTNLFDETDNGMELRPLALIYSDAVNAESTDDRINTLRKLGDIALFISGLFSGSLSRKLVDVDYYIAMGGSAYGYLHDEFSTRYESHDMGPLFGELSEKFPKLVDVLAEIGDAATPSSNSDILRLYEIWLKTGSKRALGKLQRLGVHPSDSTVSRRHH